MLLLFYYYFFFNLSLGITFQHCRWCKCLFSARVPSCSQRRVTSSAHLVNGGRPERASAHACSGRWRQLVGFSGMRIVSASKGLSVIQTSSSSARLSDYISCSFLLPSCLSFIRLFACSFRKKLSHWAHTHLHVRYKYKKSFLIPLRKFSKSVM